VRRRAVLYGADHVLTPFLVIDEIIYLILSILLLHTTWELRIQSDVCCSANFRIWMCRLRNNSNEFVRYLFTRYKANDACLEKEN